MPRSGRVLVANDCSIQPRKTSPAATPMTVAATPTMTLSLTTTPITERTGKPNARMVACSPLALLDGDAGRVEGDQQARTSTATAAIDRNPTNCSSASSKPR